MIRNYNQTCEINMQDENTDNCHFLMQEEGKMKDFHSKGKDKARLTVVPLTGNHMKIRQTKLMCISQGKEMGISAWHKKVKR